MKISTVPWEVIWLAILAIGLLALMWRVWQQAKARRFGWPHSSIFYLALILLLAIPGGLRVTNHRFTLRDSGVETTRLEHALPDLTLHEYEAYNIHEVYQASLTAIQSLHTYGQPWTITYAGEEEYRAGRIETKVPVLFWQDRLTVTIELKPGGLGVRVFVTSLTPDSRPELGENARHIKQFYDALDKALAEMPH